MIEYTVKVSENITEWYFNGKYHRENGPAIEWTNGTKEWFINGKRHREDGPAIEYPNEDKYWLINGKLHRIDGPAVEYADGNKEWWINEEALTEEEFNKKTQTCDNKIVTIDGKRYQLKEITNDLIYC